MKTVDWSRFRGVVQGTLLLLFLWTPLQDGWAWGPKGHRLTAQIAETHLETKVWEAIRQEFNIKHLRDVANWADQVKREERWKHVLHFTNIDKSADRYDQVRDCPRRKCVTEQIKYFFAVLKDRSNPPSARYDALRFLVHLVADVHQPMHLGNEEDRGGNEIRVRFRGQDTNLHVLWDTGLIPDREKPVPKHAAELSATLTPEDIADWSGGTPEDWSNESRRLVLKYGYPITLDERGEISSAYIRQGQQVVVNRLRQGGIRLAYMLNQAFQ